MTEKNEPNRLAKLEEETAWLRERVWSGTGNLHDRVHKLEDSHITAELERSGMKEDLAKVERVLGINIYGEKSVMTDLRDALDTLDKLKGNIISVKDFQDLMRDVSDLKKRGQAQLTTLNFVQFAIIGAVINIFISIISKALGLP